MKSVTRALIVGAIVVTFCAIPSSANAGSYNVSQCNASTGASLSPQWWTQLNGSWAAQNLCGAGLQVAGNGLPGVWAIHTLSLPTGLSFNSVVFGGQGQGASSDVGLFAVLCAANGLPACVFSDYEDMNRAATASIPLVAPGTTTFQFGMSAGCCTNIPSSATASIWNLDISLNDSANPAVGAPTGTLKVAAGNNWNRGTVSSGITATDGQSGVQSASAVVNSNPVGPASNSTTLSCSNLNVLPCPSTLANWSGNIATNALGDGAHTIRYSASDYSGNVTNGPTYNFKVDNTNPAAPADFELENTQAGWSQANSFDANWINPVEDEETETQSGVGSVVIDVEPTNGSQSDPAPITIPVGTTVGGISATKDSIAGLTVPDVGRWTLKLSVVDRAGNTSPLATGTEGASDEDGNPIVGYDPNPPAAPGLQNNGWVSKDQLIAGYSQEWIQPDPQSGAPICGYAGLVDTSSNANPGTTININGPVNQWTLPSSLAEGTHWVHIRSIACNGLASPTVSSVDVKVDRTEPVSYFSGVTPGRWYQNGSVVTIGANDAPSGMAPAGPFDPYNFGAYLDYSINATKPAEPARGGQAQIPVSGEGAKELRFAAVDLAGNRNSDTVVNFGIDASNPTGFLNNQDAARPTLLSAPLGDEVSGLESAVIDVQRVSGGDWITLPTGLADLSGNAVAGNPKSALASARFPDTTLPEDRYRVRVRASDQAGNPLVTDRDKSGNPLIVDSGAMRSFSGLSASLFKSKRTCKNRSKRKTRKGRSRHRVIRCTKRHRGKVIFIGGKSTVNVGFKRGAVVQGYLTNQRYGALARQPIEIYTTARGKAEVLAGVTSTKADGSYLFKLKPGVSRSVRVYYPGTETRRDTSARVTLGTGAKLVLRVSRRKARTGQTVTFRGTVRSFDRTFPASGKIIALQFYAGKKWRPAVAIARTNSKGRFAVKYKFDGKRVKARLVFRVIAPTEEGWGHATSASRRLTLKLN